VPTVTYQLLFVLLILAHDRRRIVHVAVTDILRLHGPPNNSATPFLRTARRGICCTTVMPHSRTSRPPSAQCRSTRSSRHRDHRGRTPTSSASLARSDVSASTTRSSSVSQDSSASSRTTSSTT
jgi:hypothetical protein